PRGAFGDRLRPQGADPGGGPGGGRLPGGLRHRRPHPDRPGRDSRGNLHGPGGGAVLPLPAAPLQPPGGEERPVTARVMLAAGGRRVAYGGGVVLDQVDLRVRAGEWVTILGPNGSGKTTLLRAIGAYLEPLAGSVHVDGRPAAS